MGYYNDYQQLSLINVDLDTTTVAVNPTQRCSLSGVALFTISFNLHKPVYLLAVTCLNLGW